LTTCISEKEGRFRTYREKEKDECSTKSIFDKSHVLFNLVSSFLQVSLLKVARSTISCPYKQKKKILLCNIADA